MKNTIVNLIVATAMSFSSATLAADETEGKVQPAPVQPAAAASAVPAATAPEAAAAASPAAEFRPILKPSTKRAKAMQVRPKDLDLRHCLELDNNAAIAKCAYE